MATATAAAKGPKEFTFSWEGKDKGGKVIRGELKAASETAVNATLRRQGIVVQKVKKQKKRGGGKVTVTGDKGETQVIPLPQVLKAKLEIEI